MQNYKRTFDHHTTGSTYALVHSHVTDDGVQIINIDDPYNPTNVSSISDGTKYRC